MVTYGLCELIPKCLVLLFCLVQADCNPHFGCFSQLGQTVDRVATVAPADLATWSQVWYRTGGPGEMRDLSDKPTDFWWFHVHICQVYKIPTFKRKNYWDMFFFFVCVCLFNGLHGGFTVLPPSGKIKIDPENDPCFVKLNFQPWKLIFLRMNHGCWPIPRLWLGRAGMIA